MGARKSFAQMFDSMFVVPPIYDDSYYGSASTKSPRCGWPTWATTPTETRDVYKRQIQDSLDVNRSTCPDLLNHFPGLAGR